MRSAFVLALDLGTTGVKAAAISRSGALLASAYRAYPTASRGIKIEQDPQDWENAALAALKEITSLLEARPEALALTGQMQDLILVCEGGGDLVGGASLGPAILYSDTRARAEAEEIAASYGRERLLREARNPQDASGLAPKLLWMSRNAPSAYASAGHLLLGAHDHLAYRLCGRAATDPTTASTTGLLDLDEGAWNLCLLKALGLRTDFLPEIVGSDELVGHVQARAAALTGLPQGLPIIHGCGDAGSTTLGSGAGEEGRLSINLGTSGWVALTRHSGALDSSKGIYNLRHPDGRRLIVIGAPATAAGNLDWLKDLACPGMAGPAAFELLNAEASLARPASLLYLPYLAGERSPFMDGDARAAFIGLGRESGRGELARAVMEGVALSLRSVRDALGGGAREGSAAGGTIVGGGARSALWCRILASALGCELKAPESPGDAGVRGAAFLAGRALGWHSGWDLPEAFLPVAASYLPDPEWARAYEGLYGPYSALGASLVPVWKALAAGRPGSPS